jgi:hypothetical protein
MLGCRRRHTLLPRIVPSFVALTKLGRDRQGFFIAEYSEKLAEPALFYRGDTAQKNDRTPSVDLNRTPDSPNVAVLEVIGATAVEHLFEIDFGAKNVRSIPLPRL